MEGFVTSTVLLLISTVAGHVNRGGVGTQDTSIEAIGIEAISAEAATGPERRAFIHPRFAAPLALYWAILVVDPGAALVMVPLPRVDHTPRPPLLVI